MTIHWTKIHDTQILKQHIGKHQGLDAVFSVANLADDSITVAKMLQRSNNAILETNVLGISTKTLKVGRHTTNIFRDRHLVVI